MSATTPRKKRTRVPWVDPLVVLQGLSEIETGGGVIIPPSPERFVIDYDDDHHAYAIDGERVVSATQILNATMPKPALSWWAFRIGMAAVLECLQNHRMPLGHVMTWDPEQIRSPDPAHHEVVDLGKSRFKTPLEHAVQQVKLDPNSLRDMKGTIGTSIHVAGESLAQTGVIPDFDEFPEADRGYLQALAAWFVEQEPDIIHAERIVASKRFKYAGRFDLSATLKSGSLAMCDYKTGSGLYPEMHTQLSLYDLASLELGELPFDEHFLIHLKPDGTYVMQKATINHADALWELGVMRQRQDQAARLKKLS